MLDLTIELTEIRNIGLKDGIIIRYLHGLSTGPGGDAVCEHTHAEIDLVTIS